MDGDITFDYMHATPHAVRTAQDLIRLFDLHHSIEQPINISPLLTGIDLRFESDLPPQTWGFTLDSGKRITVALNAALNSAQLRFTAVHEVGHIACWHPDQLHACIHDPAAYTTMEAEATTVAALILLPAVTVKEHVMEHAGVIAGRYCVPPALVLIRRGIYLKFGL